MHYMRVYRSGTTDAGWIALYVVQPLFDRLLEIYGTKAELARQLGIPKQGFLAPRQKFMQYKRVLLARELLRKHETHLPKDHKTNGAPLEVVETAALSLVLRAWVVEYLKERPQQENGRQKIYAGPTQVIAERAGVSVRVVSRWVNNDSGQPYVGVDVADRLLLAIDESNALIDGRLPIMANPTLNMEAWLERMSRRGCY
jgi:hypothetical protein